MPQKSWIFNATVQDNVTLRRALDRDLYADVMQASGLAKDMETFQQADLTEIGEKGANLSGGQRQRISIARALYSDQEVYMMVSGHQPDTLNVSLFLLI